MPIKNIPIFVFLTFLFWHNAFAGGGIDFLSLSEKDFGVQDAAKVLRENDSLVIRGTRALAAARISIDALLYRHFSLTLQSSNDTTGFLFWGKDSQVRLHSFVIEKSVSPKEYAFDLWAYPDFRGSLGIFGLGFQSALGEEEVVTISRMTLKGSGYPSFIGGMKRFFVPEYVSFPSINVFFGPRLWDKPFNVWVLAALGVAIFVLAGLCIAGRSISWHGAGTAIFAIALVSWIIFDARNMLNLFAIAKKDAKDFVAAARYEKLYDDLQDLYGFLHFAQDTIPQSSSLSFVSSFGAAHELRAEYMLRPRKVALGIPDDPAAKDFLVFYRYPLQINEEGKTIGFQNGEAAYKEIIPFREHSFIVKIK